MATAIVLLFGHILAISAYTRTDVETLYASLLNSSYYKDVRPNSDQSQATDVTVSLYITSIREIEETSGLFSISAFTNVAWNDERLAWQSYPAPYSQIGDIELALGDVWKPDISLANPISKVTKTGSSSDSLLRFDSDGNGSWLFGDVLDASCDIIVTDFPFDTQTCDIQFIAWGYYPNELTLKAQTEVSMLYYSENAEWVIKQTSSTNNLYGLPFIKFTFVLERRTAFFVVNIFIPVILLTILTTMGFYLPTDSGERVGYSITCLLSVSVFMTIVSDNLPRSSKPMSILGSFLMTDFILCAIFCVLTILSLRITHKDDEIPIPNWLKRATTCLMRRKCRKQTSRCEPEPETKNNDKHVESLKTLNSSNKIDSDEDFEKEITWKLVGKMFDMFCFVIGNICCFILFISYIMMALIK